MTSKRRRHGRALVCFVAISLWPVAAHADVKACLNAAEDGQKLRDSGTYRRARDRFIECAADECPGEVRKTCVGWLGELDKIVPTVVFGARAHGKEVADVRVTVDGEIVTERVDGKPVALDPGEHHFRFERPGEKTVDETAVLLAGEKERLIHAQFGAEPADVPPESSPRAASITSGPPTEAHVALPQSGRTTAYALGAVAFAGLAAGAALDISGYAFLLECNGDASCTGRHERAEVEWRFVTGDALLGAALLSGAAAWLFWSREPRGAKTSVSLVGVRRLAPGVAFGLTTSF